MQRRILSFALLLAALIPHATAAETARAQRADRERTRATTRANAALAHSDVPKASGVPAPADVLGFTPGDDRKLASWAQTVEYFRRLAAPRLVRRAGGSGNLTQHDHPARAFVKPRRR